MGFIIGIKTKKQFQFKNVTREAKQKKRIVIPKKNIHLILKISGLK